MNNKKLKVGIIGCGRMGLLTDTKVKSNLPKFYIPLSHAEAVKIHPNLVLAGVCDKSEDALAKARQLYPEVVTFKDPEVLLKELQVDLVCIATRTPERFKLIKLCFKYGIKLIHVEKPLCNSYKQLMEISEEIKRNNVHFTFGAIRRYLYPYRKAIEFFKQGEIGDLQEVSFNLGSTLLCWNHIHGIDLIQSVLRRYNINAVRAVAKSYKQQTSKSNVLDDDPQIAFIHFSTIDGPQGIISCAGGCDFLLHGNSGMIGVLNDGNNFLLRKPFVKNDKNAYWLSTTNIELREDIYNGTAAALDRLVQSSDELSKKDNNEMIYSQKLLFACVQSILLNGAPVNPDFINEDIYISGKSGGLYA